MLSQGKAESINQIISHHQHFLTVCTGQTLETKCRRIITHLIPTLTFQVWHLLCACIIYKKKICIFVFLFSACWFHFVNVFSPLSTHRCRNQRFFVHLNLLYLSPLVIPFTFTLFAISRKDIFRSVEGIRCGVCCHCLHSDCFILIS